MWALLPVVAGPALTDAVGGWDRPLRVVAGVGLWAAWGVVLVAVLAPRPLGLTAARVVAPAGLVAAAATAPGTGAGPWALAVAGTLAALVLLLSPAFAHACVNGVTYGDEQRFALRTPPAFLVGPVEVAVLAVAAGIAAGPLLLAAGRWVAGAVAVAAGWPLAALLARSVHTLARRFAVVVPAGIVVADPLQLPDPVLLPRERVAFLLPAGEVPAVPAELLDLRLGAGRGVLVLGLNVRTEAIPVRRGRTVGGVHATALAFAVQRAGALREAAVAAQRRSRVA